MSKVTTMSMMLLSIALFAVLSATMVKGDDWRSTVLREMPRHMVLHAPYTPFTTGEVAIKTEVIPALAAQAAASGVTTIWVAGSMGQFDALTVAERKQLNAAWVMAAKNHSLYVIVHVGTTVLAEARDLAAHAASIGADAIASVPPYYNKPSNEADVAKWLAAIGTAAPKTPLFYYHIPGITNVDINIATLLNISMTTVPTLVGVKYVSTDLKDWFDITQTYNTTHALLFAPEPKMQSFALGFGRGTVLAEDFFAATWIRMHAAYLRGSPDVARVEQTWKLTASAVFGKYGGAAAERAIYQRLCDVEMGQARLPLEPFNEDLRGALYADLDAIDFWTKIVPPTASL